MAKSIDKHNRRGVTSSYFSTIIGISLVLLVIGLVALALYGLDTIEKQAKESLECDIFFKPGFNEADIKQVEQELKTWEEFSDVYFVSADRAIDVFQEEDENAENILDIFDGENPMPASVSFKPKQAYASLEKIQEIESKILTEYADRVEEVNFDENSVKNVNIGFKQIVYLVGLVSILLILVAVAMINNTIRLALYSRRFSIKTMQLVGATSGYIRRPFMWQAVGMGIIGGTIGMALVLGFIYAVNYLTDFIPLELGLTRMLMLFGLLVALGILISLISTWFALNKYLKMKLDDLY